MSRVIRSVVGKASPPLASAPLGGRPIASRYSTRRPRRGGPHDRQRRSAGPPSGVGGGPSIGRAEQSPDAATTSEEVLPPRAPPVMAVAVPMKRAIVAVEYEADHPRRIQR